MIRSLSKQSACDNDAGAMRCEQPGFGSSYRGPRSRGRFKTRRGRVASGR